jgi:hypothetical protein
MRSYFISEFSSSLLHFELILLFYQDHCRRLLPARASRMTQNFAVSSVKARSVLPSIEIWLSS